MASNWGAKVNCRGASTPPATPNPARPGPARQFDLPGPVKLNTRKQQASALPDELPCIALPLAPLRFP
jgi:hypothetical protein